jgi:hypothetical protein
MYPGVSSPRTDHRELSLVEFTAGYIRKLRRFDDPVPSPMRWLNVAFHKKNKRTIGVRLQRFYQKFRRHKSENCLVTCNVRRNVRKGKVHPCTGTEVLYRLYGL